MKSCPRCGITYPDAERFCESDGTALVAVADGNATVPKGDIWTSPGGTGPYWAF